MNCVVVVVHQSFHRRVSARSASSAFKLDIVACSATRTSRAARIAGAARAALRAMLGQTLRDRHLEALGLLRGIVEVRKRHARQRLSHGALDRAEIVLLLR